MGLIRRSFNTIFRGGYGKIAGEPLFATVPETQAIYHLFVQIYILSVVWPNVLSYWHLFRLNWIHLCRGIRYTRWWAASFPIFEMLIISFTSIHPYQLNCCKACTYSYVQWPSLAVEYVVNRCYGLKSSFMRCQHLFIMTGTSTLTSPRKRSCSCIDVIFRSEWLFCTLGMR